MDFAYKEQEDNVLVVFCKISINYSENPKRGYAIFVETATAFKINKDHLNVEDFSNLKFISSLSMAIQNIRAMLHTFTASFGSIGAYKLPSVDVPSMVRQKMDTLKEPKKKK